MNKLTKIINYVKEMINTIPKSFLGLILAIIIIISPLLNDKVVYGHDYIFHATNMELNYSNINIFNLLLPKIFGGTIANGFGYGTGLFYPPLSYYLTSYIANFLNLTGEYTSLSITIVEILIVMISGVIMYAFLERVFKDNKIASLGSISYISSTYFTCDIYIRSALAESLTFIFIPLIFWGLYELFFGNDQRFSLFFIIGYVGMIHSHLVLFIYLTLIIIILFLIFPRKVFRKDKLKKLVVSSIIILLISSPFLVPMIEHKLLGNYVVFEPYSMYEDWWIEENTIELSELWTIGTKPNNIKVYINYIALIISIIVIAFNKKIFTKENRIIYKITLIIILISLFMSSSYFPWDKMPSSLKMIQFPWRLLGITSFGLSLLVGNVVKIIKGENKLLIISIIALSITLFGYNTIIHDFIGETSEIKEMSMGCQNEYLPTKTLDNIDYFNNRNQDILVKEGITQISMITNETPYLKAEITLESNNATIELPRLYYLGYDITLATDDKRVEKITYYENENGFIELKINHSGILEISYKGTIANKISNYISIFTIIICIFILIKKTL